ncbi:hypothetical protein PC9H_005144 [Pleurotus ostreatus]|uniref:Zona occludens toxin N-terminal domain-containing protein n=1 Tax=Pleurotus ostreatus TaxID=5322 RepID=A0A8H7DV90_PLEOS|nr:uncharacterized protein PC9H_005144 [Pleurotus ostreatus]KAF7433195.1 hypothetical protein PC9H_005144 [Pleurotus ostreatus]
MGKFTLLSERTNGEPSSSASLQDELELLEDCPKEIQSSKAHDTTTAPLIMRDAYIAGLKNNGATQYGVLGKTLTVRGPRAEDSFEDDRLYVNTNAPFSAIVCGVQGSGKSHTVSVLLENMFISGVGAIGTLQKPLSGLILHYGEGGSSGRPCEVAWLAVSRFKAVHPPPVKVYVSSSSLNTMRKIYAPLGSHIQVEPLCFTETELDAAAFLSMMAVGSSESAPLYIQILLSILRDLGENFTYSAFQTELDSRKRTFNPAQVAGLEQRMSLLKAFMFDKKKKHPKQTSRFAPGQITIIDLSDPFTDSASACGLFEIIVRLFTRAEVGTGKVLVVDEAHKYLTPGATSGLTQSLLRLVLTHDQSLAEPTAIPPVLLDLCMISIMHRFSSPAWWDHLVKHVSADFSGREAFDKVVTLGTGEALIIAPSALGCFKERGWSDESTVSRLGRRYMIMKTRARVTADGGASLLVI